MKLHEMMQFKTKIERKRSYFNLNNLPDDEWVRMLNRAKVESTIVKKENTLSFMLVLLFSHFYLKLSLQNNI